MDRGSPCDTPHAPATAGACAFVAPASSPVRRIGGDLLDRLELAGRQELQTLLAASAATGDPGNAPTTLDAVESVIAWDLAAGF